MGCLHPSENQSSSAALCLFCGCHSLYRKELERYRRILWLRLQHVWHMSCAKAPASCHGPHLANLRRRAVPCARRQLLRHLALLCLWALVLHPPSGPASFLEVWRRLRLGLWKSPEDQRFMRWVHVSRALSYSRTAAPMEQSVSSVTYVILANANGVRRSAGSSLPAGRTDLATNFELV